MRIPKLQDLMFYLKESNLISDDAEDHLMNMLSETVKAIVTRKLKKGGGYSSEIRSFALTLHFYSPKAYNYVRKTWNYLLLNSSTIRTWYRVVDGSPGFMDEALNAIALHTNNSKSLIINLDEMTIRKEMIFDKENFHGGIDYGTLENEKNNANKSTLTSKNASVFMAVSLNDS